MNGGYKFSFPTFLDFLGEQFFNICLFLLLILSFQLGTPKNIKYNNVKVSLESIEGVVAAHSLHIWSLTVNKAALAVHLAIGVYSKLESETL